MFWNIIPVLSMHKPLENIYFHILVENDFRIDREFMIQMCAFCFILPFIGKLSKMIKHLFKSYLLSKR